MKASIHSWKRGFDHPEDFLIVRLLTEHIGALMRDLLADQSLNMCQAQLGLESGHVIISNIRITMYFLVFHMQHESLCNGQQTL